MIDNSNDTSYKSFSLQSLCINACNCSRNFNDDDNDDDDADDNDDSPIIPRVNVEAGYSVIARNPYTVLDTDNVFFFVFSAISSSSSLVVLSVLLFMVVPEEDSSEDDKNYGIMENDLRSGS